MVTRLTASATTAAVDREQRAERVVAVGPGRGRERDHPREETVVVRHAVTLALR